MQADLHMHTEWSDGTLSIRDMALEALKRGRKYIVITDHSPRLTVANGLSPARLRCVALTDAVGWWTFVFPWVVYLLYRATHLPPHPPAPPPSPQ